MDNIYYYTMITRLINADHCFEFENYNIIVENIQYDTGYLMITMRFSHGSFLFHCFTNRFGITTKNNILDILNTINSYYTTAFTEYYNHRLYDTSDIEVVVSYINLIILTKYWHLLPDG